MFTTRKVTAEIFSIADVMHGVYFGCPGMFSPRNEESFPASGGAGNRSRARAKRRVLQNGTSQNLALVAFQNYGFVTRSPRRRPRKRRGRALFHVLLSELHTSLNECRERQTAPEFDRGRAVLTPAPTVRTRGKDCRFNPGWTSPAVVGRGHRTPCEAPNMARYYEQKIKRGEIPCTAPAKRSYGLRSSCANKPQALNPRAWPQKAVVLCRLLYQTHSLHLRERGLINAFPFKRERKEPVQTGGAEYQRADSQRIHNWRTVFVRRLIKPAAKPAVGPYRRALFPIANHASKASLEVVCGGGSAMLYES